MLLRSNQAEKRSWLVGFLSSKWMHADGGNKTPRSGITMLYNFGDLKAISLHKTLELGNFYCQSAAASRTSQPPPAELLR